MDFLVFSSMSVAHVFASSTRKAAKFISVVFLPVFIVFIFFYSDSVCQWKGLTREVRVSR